VRLGLELSLPVANGLLAGLVAEATSAEDAGFDLVWIDAAAAGQPAHTSFAMAAALAPHLRALSVGVVVHLGVDHPIYSVEEAAVTDQLLGGRLVTCLHAAPGAEYRFAEAVEVFMAGLSPRPFRHEGAVWRVPANLPENVFNTEQRLRVTPTTAQIEPVVWVTGGPAAQAVAAGHGLAYVAESGDDGAEAWPAIAAALGARALRLRRPARWPVVLADGELDVHRLVGELTAAERGWGLDTAILRLPAQLDEAGRRRVVRRIAHDVRPRVQLEQLPPGLSEYWDRQMADRLTRTRGGDDG
jgi:Luciferase-like monooxygenase